MQTMIAAVKYFDISGGALYISSVVLTPLYNGQRIAYIVAMPLATYTIPNSNRKDELVVVFGVYGPHKNPLLLYATLGDLGAGPDGESGITISNEGLCNRVGGGGGPAPIQGTGIMPVKSYIDSNMLGRTALIVVPYVDINLPPSPSGRVLDNIEHIQSHLSVSRGAADYLLAVDSQQNPPPIPTALQSASAATPPRLDQMIYGFMSQAGPDCST